jgi:SAM-dependent methyltransferase
MNSGNSTLEAALQRKRLQAWFATSLGRSLEAHEAHRLRGVLPSLYGTVALQLGRPGQLDLLDSSPAARRLLVDVPDDCEHTHIRALPEQLPLDSKCAHVALLPHTLDFCADPHAVLREVTRVLVPEGHVVIVGFNPVSLWGLRRLLARRPRAMPWCGNFLPLHRLKDWLALLDYEVEQGMMLYYRPPIQRESLIDRLHFVDKAGDRWWPLMAGVYLLVARKRVVGVTPLPVEWKRRLVGPAVARPVARGIVLPFERSTIKRPG